MSKARQLAQKPSQPTGRKNLIINGAMQVAQRGTEVTAQTNAAIKTVDRFFTEAEGCTYDHAQVSDAPDGFSNSIKATVDGAFTPTAAQYFIPFEQRIESQNITHLAYGTSAAKTVTLSFWIKSNKTGTYVVEFSNNLATSKKWSQSYTIDAANTWERKTLTWTGDTASGAGFADDNTSGATFFWWMTAGTNFTSGALSGAWGTETTANRAVGVPSSLADNDEFYLTGVQLEVGSTATEFEHRSYGEELALCQRYFFKLDFPYTTTIGTAYRGTTDSGRISLICPVPLRTLPSINSTGQPTIRFWWNDGSNAIVSTDGSISVVSNSLDANRFVLACVNATGLGNNIGSVWAYSGDLEISAEL